MADDDVLPLEDDDDELGNRNARFCDRHFKKIVCITILVTLTVLILTITIVLPLSAFATSRLHTTYVRWGSSSCPDTYGTSKILSGLMAGHHTGNVTHYLGGTNFLCAPATNVQYSERPTAEMQDGNILVGTEYQNTIKPEVNHHNVPCAVCLVSGRTTTVMYPAMTSCPQGKEEYHGYLMGQYHDYTTYVCVDEHLEVYGDMKQPEDIAHLVHVEASCAGLTCPPYYDRKELSCVVCSI